MTLETFLEQIRAINKRHRARHHLAKPLSPRKLDAWQKAHPHWPLPPSYLAFLQAANGLELRDADKFPTLNFLPLDQVQWAARQIWHDETRDAEFPPSWLCIATDANGDYFLLLDTATQHYLLIDHENPTTIASDLPQLDDLLAWVAERYLEPEEDLPPVPASGQSKVKPPKPAELVECPPFDNQEGWYSCLATAAQANIAATGDEKGWIKIWDMNQRQLLHRYDINPLFKNAMINAGVHPDALTNEHSASAIALSPDGQRLAVVSYYLFVLDRMTGQEMWHAKVDSGPRYPSLYNVAFSPDGKYIAGADGLCVIHMWEVATGRELPPFVGHPLQTGRQIPNFVSDLAFSPDGRFLASTDDYKTIRLWDIATQQDLKRFPLQRFSGHRVAFSPDGQELTCGFVGGCKTINCYRVDLGVVRLSLLGQQCPQLSLAYSPDGKHIAAAGNNGNCDYASLWDTATGQELARSKSCPASDLGAQDMGFVDNGQRLLALISGGLHLFEVPR